MSVTPPQQKATTRPAWNRVNMLRKKKQGCRPPSKRVHARPSKESRPSSMSTAAALGLSQPARKPQVAAATAARYASTSNAAAKFGDVSASAVHGFDKAFIAWLGMGREIRPKQRALQRG